MANLTRYTEEEKERALTVAAIHHGNLEGAAKQLERDGRPVPYTTLRGWIKRDPARFQAILDHRVRVVDAEIEGEVRDQIYHTLQARKLSLAATVDQLEKGEAKDPSAVDRNLVVSTGILTTKIMELTNKLPTHRVEIDDLRSAERVLSESGLVVDAEVVEENPVHALDVGSS